MTSSWPRRSIASLAIRRTSPRYSSACNSRGFSLITLGEGEIGPLHIGLKGTMNALFLKDLADKVRRGLRGRVEAGRSGGGNAYGYDLIRSFDAKGEPLRGGRTINAVEAAVVREIFSRYAAGESPRGIALGSMRAPSPLRAAAPGARAR